MNDVAPHSWAGDPTVLGWSVTVAYLLTFLLLAANMWRARANDEPFSFWLLASLVVFVLGVNKQLDLQTWLHQSAKAWVQSRGLYEHRRMLQLAFVAALALGGVVTIALLRKWIVRAGRRYGLVVFGLGVSVFFVVTRAASIHVLDRMIGSATATEAVGAALEIVALGLIIVGGVRGRSRPGSALPP